jgi:glycosyltransferase involved in cell wall biosynthesis
MSDESLRDLSIVIPVLDEEATVADLHARIRSTLGAECEIVFVDDGSRDRTRGILSELAAKDPRTRVLGFRRNYGKSQALAVGFRRSSGRIVATLDGDLQDDPGELRKLIVHLDDGYDVVGGWRKRRKDGFGKILSSRVFNRVVSFTCGKRFRDVNCGMKVFRREVVDDLVLEGGFHRFLPVLALWRGFRVREEEVEHHPRRHGGSRYGRLRGLRAILDLWVIFFLMRFGGRPGRFFLGIGSVFGLSGFSISLYIAVLRLTSESRSIESKFPLMALGLVCLVIGFQMVALGLFGELLSYHFRTLRSVEPLVQEEGDGR